MKPVHLTRREFLKVLGGASLAHIPRLTHMCCDAQAQPCTDSANPNILIVIFDALSAAHIPLYGYPRQTMPNLERLAHKALVYHRHYAGGNFTTPGTASLLTGAYPWSHRGINLHGTIRESFVERSLFRALGEGRAAFAYSHNPLVNNLLFRFRQDIDLWKRVSDLCLVSDSYADQLFFYSDYNIANEAELLLFRNGSGPNSSFFLSRFERLKRYFSWLAISGAYQNIFPRGVPSYWDEVAPSYMIFTIEAAIDWLKMQVDEQPQPYLGYVHLLPPHNPYSARHEFVDRFADGWAPSPKPELFFSDGHAPDFLQEERRSYDEYIAYVDAEFVRLYDHMERSGALENTILIFTSDHGEMFERGIYGHLTPTLYEPILRVPLLIWAPHNTQRRDIFTPTSCVDILPTLCKLAGQPIPDWSEGQVLPGFAGQVEDRGRSVWALDAKENSMHAALRKATLALIHGPHKLVHYLGYEQAADAYEFYDLENDPQEQVNLYPQNLPEIEAMKAEMAARLAAVNQPYGS